MLVLLRMTGRPVLPVAGFAPDLRTFALSAIGVKGRLILGVFGVAV